MKPRAPISKRPVVLLVEDEPLVRTLQVDILREAELWVLETQDAEFVNEAAKRGIFAYVTDGDPEELQGAVDIVLRRFAEFHRLEGALGRRALTERAKGILMERYGIDERQAFEMLRSHSRRTGRKLIDVAEALTTSHLLLATAPAAASGNSHPAGREADGFPAPSPSSDRDVSPGR